jgi:hypothetical protein
MELSYRSLVRRGREGGIVVVLDPVAAGTLWEAVAQTRDLVAGHDSDGSVTLPPSDDPFDAIVADLRRSPQATPPDDPVLRRLLPDGVRADEVGAAEAAEFRSATEHGLRRRKVEAMDVVLEDLARLRDGTDSVLIPAQRVRSWLVGVNDARLALGALLDIRSDEDLMAELDEYLDDVDLSNPGEDERTLRAYRILVYDMLTELQNRILAAATR